MTKYLTRCNRCQLTTSRKFARTHGGQCKSCHAGKPRLARDVLSKERFDSESTSEFRSVEADLDRYPY